MMVLAASQRRNPLTSNRASIRRRQASRSTREAFTAAIASSMSVQSSSPALVRLGKLLRLKTVQRPPVPLGLYRLPSSDPNSRMRYGESGTSVMV